MKCFLRRHDWVRIGSAPGVVHKIFGDVKCQLQLWRCSKCREYDALAVTATRTRSVNVSWLFSELERTGWKEPE